MTETENSRKRKKPNAPKKTNGAFSDNNKMKRSRNNEKKNTNYNQGNDRNSRGRGRGGRNDRNSRGRGRGRGGRGRGRGRGRGGRNDRNSRGGGRGRKNYKKSRNQNKNKISNLKQFTPNIPNLPVLNNPLCKASSKEQCENFWNLYKEHFSLSTIESVSSKLKNKSFLTEPIPQSVENEPEPEEYDRFKVLLKRDYSNVLKKRPEEEIAEPSPTVVCLVTSAKRSIEIFKSWRDLPFFFIEQLFGKHKKIEDQLKYLKKGKVNCVIGTPDRIMKILNRDGFRTNYVKLLVLDTFFNVKKRSLLNMEGVTPVLMELVKTYFMDRIKEKKTKIFLY
ncbi:protein cmss1 [Anaeramoeba flamelloides]|uniref:Protein cmss1 n=1 Tax=Anaeramoeba flamelloides TaxID=1746091 RepID=A0AAV8A2X2_9EUKA|nr:protein cmss1 [Anaeramoeba flamelloides]